jgi:hypothetical protein
LTLGEEEFGEIETLTRLAHTNPSFGTDRMDDYQAMYHEISGEQPPTTKGGQINHS